jgi:hypothetical protein
MDALIIATSSHASAAVPHGNYHDAVSAFKRRLIESTLQGASGNRTHAARALGLQRTYLLRLIRELRVTAPPPPTRGRPAGARADEVTGAARMALAAGTRPGQVCEPAPARSGPPGARPWYAGPPRGRPAAGGAAVRARLPAPKADPARGARPARRGQGRRLHDRRRAGPARGGAQIQ